MSEDCEDKTSRHVDYVRDHEGLLALPMMCDNCGQQLANEPYQLIGLRDSEPVCRDCIHEADELVSTESHYGYPNNNRGLDLDSAVRWLVIADSLEIEAASECSREVAYAG